MIPYIFVTWAEFKKVFTFQYSYFTYFKATCWYLLLCSPIFAYFFLDITITPLTCSTNKYLCSIYSVFTITFFLILYLIKGLLVTVPREMTKDDKMEESFRNKISILIACYNAEDIIEKTIQHIIVHFPGESIYIADNNRTKQPPNNKTREICEKYGANYYYVPRPSKTNALNTVVHFIDKKYKYVIALDDDTLLQDTFCPSEKFFLEDDRVAGVGFGLSIDSRKSFVERCVNLEYTLFAWDRYCKNVSSSLFMSGAAGLWRTDLFKVALKYNPAGKQLPYGEDGWNGVIMRMNNYKFKQDFQNFLKSYTPDTLYFGINEFKCGKSSIGGFGATNLFKQRALRWYRSGTVKLLNDAFSIFTMDASNRNNSIFRRVVQNIHYRFFMILNLTILFWITMSIPTVIYFVSNLQFNLYTISRFFMIQVILYITTITYLLFNKFIFRKRPDLVMDLGTIFIFPFYLTYSVILRTIGLISTLLFYIPFHTPISVFGRYKLNIEEEIESMPTKEELNRNQIIDMIGEKTIDITDILTKNPELITKEIVEKLNIIKEEIIKEVNINEEIEEIDDVIELDIVSEDEELEKHQTLHELKEEIDMETLKELLEEEIEIVIR